MFDQVRVQDQRNTIDASDAYHSGGETGPLFLIGSVGDLFEQTQDFE